MRDIYLGDSYDLVKRFWAQALNSVAPLYIHTRFVLPDLRERLTKLTTMPMLDREKQPETKFAILLDPHTGIPLPDSQTQRVSIALAPISFLIDEFNSLEPEYMICFDQTHDRNRSKELNITEQREAKRDALIEAGISSFYYLSHAPFLFMARDIGVLTAVRNLLVDAGIPEHTPSKIRLQPIRTTTSR